MIYNDVWSVTVNKQRFLCSGLTPATNYQQILGKLATLLRLSPHA